MEQLFGANLVADRAHAKHAYGTRTPLTPEEWRKENRKLAEVPPAPKPRKTVVKKKESK